MIPWNDSCMPSYCLASKKGRPHSIYTDYYTLISLNEMPAAPSEFSVYYTLPTVHICTFLHTVILFCFVSVLGLSSLQNLLGVCGQKKIKKLIPQTY